MQTGLWPMATICPVIFFLDSCFSVSHPLWFSSSRIRCTVWTVWDVMAISRTCYVCRTKRTGKKGKSIFSRLAILVICEILHAVCQRVSPKPDSRAHSTG